MTGSALNRSTPAVIVEPLSIGLYAAKFLNDIKNKTIAILGFGPIGIPEKDEIRFNPHDLRRNEVCIQNVRRQNNCVEEAIKLIADGSIQVDSMITHTFAPQEIEKAFRLVSGYKDGVIKALVKM